MPMVSIATQAMCGVPATLSPRKAAAARRSWSSRSGAKATAPSTEEVRWQHSATAAA